MRGKTKMMLLEMERKKSDERETSGMLGCEKPVGQSDETRGGKRWRLEGENSVWRMLRESERAKEIA